MTHELKIWPQYYCRVADGSKTFEVRKNDRGFQPGDIVTLREWDPKGLKITESLMSIVPRVDVGDYTDSPTLIFKVGYVLPIDDDRVVFSLLKADE